MSGYFQSSGSATQASAAGRYTRGSGIMLVCADPSGQTEGYDGRTHAEKVLEAVRALGYLRDSAATELLQKILADNMDPKTANLYLAEASIEALLAGRAQNLVEVQQKLFDYFHQKYC